jgi:hypothetical protein
MCRKCNTGQVHALGAGRQLAVKRCLAFRAPCVQSIAVEVHRRLNQYMASASRLSLMLSTLISKMRLWHAHSEKELMSFSRLDLSRCALCSSRYNVTAEFLLQLFMLLLTSDVLCGCVLAHVC